MKHKKSPKKKFSVKKTPLEIPKIYRNKIPKPIFGSIPGKKHFTVLDWINNRAKILRQSLSLTHQEAIKYASSEHNKWKKSFQSTDL